MRKRKILWPHIFLVLATSGTLAIVGGQDFSGPAAAPMNSAAPTSRTPSQSSSRNLALQPEALKLSRRLGRRFIGPQLSTTTMDGTLRTESGMQAIRMTRRQTDRGERIEIQIGAVPSALTWDQDEGTKSGGATASDSERTAIERLVLDSVDQFVGAQFRGASYYTVGHNVRPAAAGDSDNYDGPLWDVIRVHEPNRDAEKTPQSPWHLYYINSTTGLIDKVVSDFRGEKIETTFTRWTAQGGEKFPSLITWRRQGQLIMEFAVTNFVSSRSAQ
jgi:hypothetical protein